MSSHSRGPRDVISGESRVRQRPRTKTSTALIRERLTEGFARASSSRGRAASGGMLPPIDSYVERPVSSVARMSNDADGPGKSSSLYATRTGSEQNRNYRSLLDGIPECVTLIGSDGSILEINSAGRRMLEADPLTSLTGVDFLEFIASEHREQFRSFNDEICGGNDRHLAFDLITAHGCRLQVETHGIPFRNTSGEIVQLSITRNVTEVRRAERQQTLLIQELSHRFKNTLGTVQSIVSQTLRNSTDFDEAKQSLQARISTLARAYDTMLEGNWESADLRGIIEAALEPFLAAGGSSIRMDGPEIQLYPSQAKALSMVFHELATNASKYGALTTDGGRVEIIWGVKGAGASSVFALRWRETSGPAIQPPEQQGFGTRMIHAVTASELGGEAIFIFPQSGLVCEMIAPADRLAPLSAPR